MMIIDDKGLPKSNHNSEENGYLIKIKPLKKIIECVLISPYIKNEKLISLLIVAKPESGKSSVMKQYRNNKGISYITDCTAYGLTRDVLPKIVSGEVKTIMIPDLLTPLSKQTKTRQSLIAFLNNLIEEGVAKITTYSNIWNKDVNANVITAVTNGVLRDARRNWVKMGFLSRFIIFSYSYNLSTVSEILSKYSEHGIELRDTKIKLPKKQVKIKLSKEIADKLDPIAMKIGEQFDLYGFRAKINFRCLLKCLAYRNNRRRNVNEDDFNELLELVDYMNLDYNHL